MKQLQLVRVEVGELVQGMYVANLDRPWLGSPFLLEGFLLEQVDDLEKLRALCQYVMVDVGRSAAACHPGLLARLGPQQKPEASGRAPAARRVTASLVQEPSARQGRDPDRLPVGAALATIMRETVRGAGGPAREGEHQTTISRDTDRAAAGATLVMEDIGGAARSGGRDGGAEGNGQPWTSSSHGAGDKWNGKERRRWAREPRPAGLSGDDEASLAGLAVDFQTDGRRWSAGPQLREAHRLQDNTRTLIGEFLADVRADRVLDIQKAETVISEMFDSLERNPESLRMLSHLKTRDDYSFVHAFDCAVHMMGFSQVLGYGRETRKTLGLAGLVIDLGKIRLPDEILRSTDRLTPAQFNIAREHVMHSVDILRGSPNMSTQVLEVVGQHHERLDGSGYPYRLKGKEVSPLAAISGIVDTYTALTSRRPHQEAVSIHTALTTLQYHAGRLFNEGMVEEFIQYVGLYPVGALVELNTGEVGLVVNQNRVRRLKPTVMVLLDHEKKRLNYPQLVNLMLDPPAFPDGTPYTILQDLRADAFPELNPTEFYLQPGQDEAA